MSYTSDNDESLIGSHAGGDATAFEVLYRRYEMRTWRYLQHSVSNRAKAEELMQSLWFAVAKDGARFQSTVRFATWLYSIAYGQISAQISDSVRAMQFEEVAGEPSTAIARALGQLPLEQRGAFLLQMEGELGIQDIAAITNSSLDDIQGYLQRARSELAERLGAVMSGDDQQKSLEDVNDRYRRASEADVGRPSEWVRRKVLAHGAQVAAEQAVKGASSVSPTRNHVTYPAPELAKRALPGFAIWGAAGLVAVSGLLAAWHFWIPRELPAAVSGSTRAKTQVPADGSQPRGSSEVASPEVLTQNHDPMPLPEATSQVAVPSDGVNAQTPSPASEGTEAAAPQEPQQANPTPRQSLQPAIAAPSSPTTVTGKSRGTRQSTATAARGLSSAVPTRKLRTAAVRSSPQGALTASAPSASDPKVNSTVLPSTVTPSPSAAAVATTSGSDAAATTSLNTSTAPAGTAGGTESRGNESGTAAPSQTSAAGLWRAAQAGDIDGLRTAFADHVDINSRNAEGRTALMLAIRHGQTKAVRELLAHGADPNVADGHGLTPLHAAALTGNYPIVAALKHAGAQ